MGLYFIIWVFGIVCGFVLAGRVLTGKWFSFNK